ncbi:MAG: hypothetical protein JST06_07005 [Bacteroidetes bacterium]|nr:hypothetical protein [Bacteroidota bacterium]MBS1629496.1 hypothetical protein [Bacteroidota bacterium]
MNRICFFIIILFVISCNDNEAGKNFIDYRVDSLTWRSSESRQNFQDPKSFIIALGHDTSGVQVASLFFPESGIIYNYSLANNGLISTFRLSNMQKEDCYSFCLTQKGDIWFSFANKLLIYEYQHGYRIKRTYNFLPQLDSQFTCFAYLNSVPLEIDDSHAMPDSTAKFGLIMDSKSIMSPNLTLAERYSRPCVGRFKVVNDSVRCIDSIVFFPESHRKKFHYSRFPFIVNVGTIIYYVFDDGDSIYSYNLVTKKRQPVVFLNNLDEDYRPILMEEDSTYSIPYVIKNAIMSPSIRLFLFDPNRKVFYLGIKKRQSYLTEEGSRINDMLDYPFRILVLDEHFRKVKSVDFPKGRFRALYDAFVGEKGLYLMTNSKKSISYEVYDFGGAGSN